jgi:hypothetical protein
VTALPPIRMFVHLSIHALHYVSGSETSDRPASASKHESGPTQNSHDPNAVVGFTRSNFLLISRGHRPDNVGGFWQYVLASMLLSNNTMPNPEEK